MKARYQHFGCFGYVMDSEADLSHLIYLLRSVSLFYTASLVIRYEVLITWMHATVAYAYSVLLIVIDDINME